MNTKNNEPHIKFAVLATDVAILTLRGNQLLVRFMRVDRPPFYDGLPGLPGGLIGPEETAEETALRIVKEKGEIRPAAVHIEQLATFSAVHRDKRGRVVAVAYSAYVPWENLSTSERDDSKELWWSETPVRGTLAYDHREILTKAIERLRSRVRYTTLISKLMPRDFTLTQLEQAYASILGKDLDKRNFRKKFDKLKLLEETGATTAGDRGRPAKLYRFKEQRVQEMDIL